MPVESYNPAGRAPETLEPRPRWRPPSEPDAALAAQSEPSDARWDAQDEHRPVAAGLVATAGRDWRRLSARWALGLWALGALLMLARQLAGARRFQKLVRTGAPASPELAPAIPEV